MVTTRGGVETPGTWTPKSSNKKRAGKRELAALEVVETPTQAKRQKKGAQESSEDSSDTFTVTVAPTPSTQDAGQTAAEKGKLAIRRRSSPQVVVVEKLSPPASTATESFEQATEDDAPRSTQKSDFDTPRLRSGTAHGIPVTTSKASRESPTPKAGAVKTVTPASAKKQRGRPRKAQTETDGHSIELTQTTTTAVDEIPSSTFESEQAPIPSQDALVPSPRPTKAHKRFGSEEPIDTVVVDTKSAEPGHQDQKDDDDDSASDSDEAPELVTTAAATSKAQAAQAEASRALVAQQEKEAAKRKAREELVAAQQAAKREREEKKAKRLARQQAKEAATSAPESQQEEQDSVNFDITRKGLPALLPDSLLSTLSDQRAPTPPPTRGGKSEEELRREKLKHHIKFLERTEKPIKEMKKGKLSVAVLAQHNKVLPPKKNKDTSNVREHWLKSRGLEKKKGAKQKFKTGKVERRRVGNGGFLKNGD
ncbi:hypothetical protein LEMA_P106360.1 [Plenodomus lingam JN3]|uniref:Uncharacterized protein n=2 Tax=Leptosphaeria maculans TaxID=5022 RepID=E5A149_LEPMJ|nr:hypothetical protein LEMA_P106360.1 [Plenodomus lingam JN3]CBX97505.1 hypothetical protein LEMA_P106360.1 [Plenodomus lingam JN3]